MFCCYIYTTASKAWALNGIALSVCLLVCMCMYVCMCVCLFVCPFVYLRWKRISSVVGISEKLIMNLQICWKKIHLALFQWLNWRFIPYFGVFLTVYIVYFQIKFFNDPVICTLQMLDTIEQKDPFHRTDVHCQLAQVLPDIPKVSTFLLTPFNDFVILWYTSIAFYKYSGNRHSYINLQYWIEFMIEKKFSFLLLSVLIWLLQVCINRHICTNIDAYGKSS